MQNKKNLITICVWATVLFIGNEVRAADQVTFKNTSQANVYVIKHIDGPGGAHRQRGKLVSAGDSIQIPVRDERGSVLTGIALGSTPYNEYFTQKLKSFGENKLKGAQFYIVPVDSEQPAGKTKLEGNLLTPAPAPAAPPAPRPEVSATAGSGSEGDQKASASTSSSSTCH